MLGARSVLNAAKGRTDALSGWALALQERRGYWRAIVAIAAKNARMAWAMLARGIEESKCGTNATVNLEPRASRGSRAPQARIGRGLQVLRSRDRESRSACHPGK